MTLGRFLIYFQTHIRVKIVTFCWGRQRERRCCKTHSEHSIQSQTVPRISHSCFFFFFFIHSFPTPKPKRVRRKYCTIFVFFLWLWMIQIKAKLSLFWNLCLTEKSVSKFFSQISFDQQQLECPCFLPFFQFFASTKHFFPVDGNFVPYSTGFFHARDANGQNGREWRAFLAIFPRHSLGWKAKAPKKSSWRVGERKLLRRSCARSMTTEKHRKRIQHTLAASQRIVKNIFFTQPWKNLFSHFDYSNNLHKQSTKLNDFRSLSLPRLWMWASRVEGCDVMKNDDKIAIEKHFSNRNDPRKFFSNSALFANCFSTSWHRFQQALQWHRRHFINLLPQTLWKIGKSFCALVFRLMTFFHTKKSHRADRMNVKTAKEIISHKPENK